MTPLDTWMTFGFVKKKQKHWFDKDVLAVNSLLTELHAYHIEYVNDKNSQPKKKL